MDPSRSGPNEDAVLAEATNGNSTCKQPAATDPAAPTSRGGWIPSGGLVSTVFNFCALCIGAGVFSLPSASCNAGIIMTIFYLLLISSLTVYSLYCLGLLMERTGLKTYEEMAGALLGRGFHNFNGVLRAVNTFGGCVVFIKFIMGIVETTIKVSGTSGFWSTTGGSRLITFLMWLFIMLPLVIPRKIDSLRYVSTIGVSFIFYFLVVIVVHSFRHGLQQNIQNISPTYKDSNSIVLFNSGNAAVQEIGSFMFAFLCQTNSFELYYSMAQPSANRFTLHASIAMAICVVIYMATGIFGYLDFGNSVKGSVLENYNPIDESEIMVGFLGVFIKLCVSFALLLMASRNATYSVINWDPDTVPFWKHAGVVIAIATSALLLGLFGPNLKTVILLLGSFCGGVSGFFFPALFVMYSGNWKLSTVGWFHFIMTYLVLMTGVVGISFGVVSTIYAAL
ncbi:putative Transmembrane amino acid transporter protein [Trypanosoma vivax]|uniref:Amino acid transporter n=1 Tax=Trypanosoma vivax (strain Y486) TaxID=1055687 RepID=G0TZY3_TRYVY|nr:amino acid transporter [Trypanosoma vivax]KAH8616184.1 putative Transmembrane amino acid transporter protein [Trypanosoma vivax]CCC50163.1 amino acid transporter [Trypanosoma vivax Y486]